jgi:hypothetical protein
MVLLVLVVLWIVVLAPSFIKKVLERQSTGSIESFHHQLHLLERTGPKLVTPAYRLETAQPSTGTILGKSGFPSVSSRPGRPNLVLLQPVAGGVPGIEGDVVDEASGEHYRRLLPPAVDAGPGAFDGTPRAFEGVPPAGSARFARQRVDDYRRRQTRRRRRDLLIGLLASLLLTALLGIVPSLHALWVVSALSGVGLAAYVVLAAYAQLLEADRHSPPRRMGGYSYSYSSSVVPDPPRAAALSFSGALDGHGSQEEENGYCEEEYAPRLVAADR